MLHFRKNKPRDLPMLRLPLVAFIDVVLFLLLYFVMAGSLTPAEGKLSSALAAEHKGPGAGTSDMTTQILRVDMAQGRTRYRIGGREMFDRAPLRATLDALPKAPGIIVKVSDDAPVEAAVGAMQIIRDAGFTKVSYVAG